MEPFITVGQQTSAEIVEKKSRFIAHIAPVSSEEDALAFLENVRAEHRMARHNVYAYILREGKRMRYSDDGEPSKTAGMPVLQTLQHAQLSDVIVVVTRYFGGTLLGTGGLVRAYTQATQEVIEEAELVQMSVCVDFTLKIPYSLYDQAVHISKHPDVRVLESNFAEEVSLSLVVREEASASMKEKFNELLRDQGVLIISDPYQFPF
ncbi:MAG: YigZ family protein [Raoultibacter sp.]